MHSTDKIKLSDSIRLAKKPFLIAGPCSVESPTQVMETALALSDANQVDVLRGGVWKPRTRPDSFEGIGEQALPWLIAAGKAIDKPVIVEVANAKHVDAALKHGVNQLWIGARTTVNPFAVQEIADALKGIEIPIMIKNPINPDLMLWVGAIERFLKAGISDITAIHRGFSVYNHPKYRNIPNWEIPIGLKEIFEDLPLLCDPSHIVGRRDGIAAVAQKAMDLNFDGLMIESHIQPELALSDNQQQLTPNDLSIIFSNLRKRKQEVSKDELLQLEIMRDKIAQLDDQIIHAISYRMGLAEEIGDFKRDNDITILQQDHWKKVIAHRLEQSSKVNLSQTFMRSLMDAIHQESIRRQTKVMNPFLENVEKTKKSAE